MDKLTVNKEYASSFMDRKDRESALQRVYDESSGSESSETEDDDADLLTETLDDDISATLQMIRNKDPRIYDKDVQFYEKS